MAASVGLFGAAARHRWKKWMKVLRSLGLSSRWSDLSVSHVSKVYHETIEKQEKKTKIQRNVADQERHKRHQMALLARVSIPER
jgi:hypothetical protein